MWPTERERRLLQIEQRSLNDDVSILDVSGHVDMSNCFRLHEAIIHEVDTGRTRLVLNLHSLNFIDSSCLGVLLRGLERVHREKGSMVLVSNQFVDRVLTLTGLTHLLVSYGDEDSAVEALRAAHGRKRATGG